MNSQLLNAAGTVLITVVVLFILIVGAGFWLLARRRASGHVPDALGALQQRANILLVRVDDAIKNGEDELGYAIAQFGDVKSQNFEKVLADAKEQLREAFSLQQKLDDAYPDTETQRREWSGRIITLCESAQSALDEQENAFASLRELEKNAPENLAAARRAIATSAARTSSAEESLKVLRHDYLSGAITSVVDNVDRARTELAAANKDAESAESLLGTSASARTPKSDSSDERGTTDGDGAAAATSAVDLIRSAGEHAYRAGKLFDAIDALRDELGKARDAVAALRESTATSLSDARAVRDAPPDAAVGAAVGLAVKGVEKALATDSALKDPLATLEILRAANAELDASMSGARNQQQRLAGARTALVGALVGARSQIASTRNYIDTRRGGVGSEARTRLAEAERLLSVAEAETDPVAALDTARSSATYSRDADALARFDLLGR
jgi:hypothetical protein